MILRTLQLADDDAWEAATWYDERRPGLGDDFLDAYAAALEVIEAQPRRFARHETTRSHREFRRYLLRRFPYAIIYEIRADELWYWPLPIPTAGQTTGEGAPKGLWMVRRPDSSRFATR